MHYVYIIRSQKDGGVYVGITANLEQRLEYHNAKRVRSTEHQTPFTLIHQEAYPDRFSAREREKYLKSYAGAKEKFVLIGK